MFSFYRIGRYIIYSIVMAAISCSIAFGQANMSIKAKIEEFADIDVKAGIDMKISDIVKLFHDRDATLSDIDIATIYKNEYLKEKKRHEGTLNKFKESYSIPSILVLISTMLLFIIRDRIKEAISKLLDNGYNKLAGNPFLWKTALKRYKQSLLNEYKKKNLPFRPNHPLDIREIFVPLKVVGCENHTLIDAYQIMQTQSRMMVVGIPGSGKSMLMKHIALCYAADDIRYPFDNIVPILIELKSLNNSQRSLEQWFVQTLAMYGFPHSEKFVRNNLEDDKLLLLFDGLDEVRSTDRARVVQEISELLQQYSGCRAIITCRTAVYRDEFAELFGQKMELAEFEDKDIRCFLKSWKMRPAQSTAQLLQTLQDRPRIMAMARNPLLLTIVAYLYTDVETFELPHSRTEFYQEATRVLLDALHHEANQYKVVKKQAILKHLALFNQDKASLNDQDVMSIEYTVMVEQLRIILPKLNLSDNDLELIINEIVERSGLLLAIDGGERYQFAHLTLQEYFAAESLLEDFDGLLRRFISNPDGWRETIKLWCGLNRDSSELIRYIYNIDPIVGFECLSDAQQVDQSLAESIINEFKMKLGESYMNESVLRAFGTVSSDIRRPRGKNLFDFMRDTLENTTDNTPLYSATASALAYTNLPEAAQILIHNRAAPEAFRALIRMGDIAVDPIISHVKQHDYNLITSLALLGTPKAAESIIQFLWHQDVQINAAWTLAAILYRPDVVSTLGDIPINELQRTKRKSNGYEWVWEPFVSPNSSALQTITGRIVELLVNSKSIEPPDRSENGVSGSYELDPRVIIPLFISRIKDKNYLALKDEYSINSKKINNAFDKQVFYRLKHIEQMDYDFCYYFGMLRFLSSTIVSNLLKGIMLCKRIPTRNDWICQYSNIYDEPSFMQDTYGGEVFHNERLIPFKNRRLIVTVVVIPVTTLSISALVYIFLSPLSDSVMNILFYTLLIVLILIYYREPATDNPLFNVLSERMVQNKIVDEENNNM